MKISTSILLILALGIFSCQDPNSPTSTYTVTVSGFVINKSNAPQDSVVVTLDNPFRRDTTKSDGSFSYSFTSTEKSEITASFKFSHINLSFRDTILTRSYSTTKKSITFGEVTMTGVTPYQDSLPPTKASARAGIVAFVSSSFQSISIRGAGGNDVTNMTFEVRDSVGIPVDEKNRSIVAFKLVTKPDNLVELNHATAVTGSNGQVIVQLTSGDKAGIAQVQAITTVKNAVDTTKMDTIKSQIVSVTIAGGAPVASRFTIGSAKVNIPGLVKFNLRNMITAVVGDTFGNPVQQGTLVYFSTSGGIILPYSKTAEDGTVGVDLITGNPIPANGIAVITAQVGTSGAMTTGSITNKTVDESVIIKPLRSKGKSVSNSAVKNPRLTMPATTFTKTINVLFSGAPRITSNDAVFIVPHLGTKQFQFTVDDINGNPMSQGTTITVTGVGLDTTGAVLSGDLVKVLPDTKDTAYTKFTISISDKRTKNLNVKQPITINVEVAGDNGNIKKSFTGELSPAVPDSGGLPAQSQFSVSLPKKNYSTLTDKSALVTVTAGDAFGNPAKTGTVINFRTNGGLIDGNGTTNSSGAAIATLQIVNPMPPSGIATIEAKTYGVGGIVIRDTQTVVFSREAIISEVGGPFANFEIDDGLSKTFQFSVSDINGNPLSQGNVISVQASGQGANNIVLSGDVLVTTMDTKIQGIGTTQFTFTARDTVKDEGQGPKPLTFKISVVGPNTSGTTTRSFNGTLKGGAGSGNEGSVASVSYARSSKDTIFVANAGIPTTDTITYKVRNLSQLPVKGAAVQFSFTQSANASEFLSPSYAVSDDSGEVKVVVHSGIKAGVMKVIGTVTAGSSVTSSSPVSVYVKTGPLFSIALISVDKKEISVRGVGGDENATIVYEARDLLGNSLDYANQTKLFFGLTGVTGFDEQVKPDSAMTDPFTGRASVTVSSGTRSTVLQVIARNAGGTITSSPVPIVVDGGFTVDSLFIFKSISQNFSIYGSDQTIVMQLGDKYGNPPKIGTAVYFQTNAGIVTAASYTDASGIVSTKFTPVANTSYLGNKTITASTVGNATDGLIQKTFTILMSGKPVIPVTNVPTDTVTLFDGSSTDINYEIKDNLGNPISGGHQYDISIESSISSQLALGGNIFGLLPDTQDKVNGTKFSFSVSDNIPNSGTSGTFKIKITVTGVTGTTIKTIYGKLLAPENIIVPPRARTAASIALISSSSTDLSIAGVGGTENATLTYEVRDSVGAPITIENKAVVSFKTNFSPNTYTPGGTAPTILPSIDSTDASGRIRVSILSGTQAGALQLDAIINLTSPVRTIKSQPVKISVNSGFADQGHFTIAPAVYNFPGLQKAFYSTTITVQVGDKYSNPVKEGTTVYFNSANGLIQTQQGLTDKNGFVSMALYSGNPYPLSPNLASGLTNGFSRVYARTIGRDSSFITDSLEILWTGSPVITKTDAINTFTILNGGSEGPFTFTVQDYLGHPMSAGTTITVDAPGLTVNGDANVTMPDTKSSGAGLTSFSFTVKDANTTDTDPPAVSLITITVTHPVYGTFKKVIASGTVD